MNTLFWFAVENQVEEKMNEEKHVWAGNIVGTNTGRVFLDVFRTDNDISGSITINDDHQGAVEFQIVGKFLDGNIEFTGQTSANPENGKVSQVKLSAKQTPEGNLSGRWQIDESLKGAIYLYPHLGEVANVSKFEDQKFFSKSSYFGLVRLNVSELERITEIISNEFEFGKLFITYTTNTSEVTKSLLSFFSSVDVVDEPLKFFRLFVQEPDKLGVYKQVLVEFDSQNKNFIQVQGTSQAWVGGMIKNLERTLRQFEKPILTNIKKWGINLNLIAAATLLILVFELESSLSRTLCVISFLVGMYLLNFVHYRFIPTVLVNLEQNKISVWGRYKPSLLSIMIGVISIVIGNSIYFGALWFINNVLLG